MVQVKATKELFPGHQEYIDRILSIRRDNKLAPVCHQHKSLNGQHFQKVVSNVTAYRPYRSQREKGFVFGVGEPTGNSNGSWEFALFIPGKY